MRSVLFFLTVWVVNGCSTRLNKIEDPLDDGIHIYDEINGLDSKEIYSLDKHIRVHLEGNTVFCDNYSTRIYLFKEFCDFQNSRVFSRGLFNKLKLDRHCTHGVLIEIFEKTSEIRVVLSVNIPGIVPLTQRISTVLDLSRHDLQQRKYFGVLNNLLSTIATFNIQSIDSYEIASLVTADMADLVLHLICMALFIITVCQFCLIGLIFVEFMVKWLFYNCKLQYEIFIVKKMPRSYQLYPTNTCPVCLDTVDDEEIHYTTCGHGFCELCLAKLDKLHKAKCPICRAELSPFFKTREDELAHRISWMRHSYIEKLTWNKLCLSKYLFIHQKHGQLLVVGLILTALYINKNNENPKIIYFSY